ncbi:MAG: hypothetical protein ACXQTM_05030 [Methanosarcinales archaeon]
MAEVQENVYCKLCYGPCVWMVVSDTGYEYMTDPGAFADEKTYALRCQWCGFDNDIKRGSELNK